MIRDEAEPRPDLFQHSIPLRLEDIRHLTAEDFDRIFPAWRSVMPRLLRELANRPVENEDGAA